MVKNIFPIFCFILVGFSVFILLLSPVRIKIEVIGYKNHRQHKDKRESSALLRSPNKRGNDFNPIDNKIASNIHYANGERIMVFADNKTDNHGLKSKFNLASEHSILLSTSTPHVPQENNNNYNIPAFEKSINQVNYTNFNKKEHVGHQNRFINHSMPKNNLEKHKKTCRSEEASQNWRGDCITSMDCPANQFCFRRNGISLCRDTCSKKSKNLILQDLQNTKQSSNILGNFFSSADSPSQEDLSPRKDDVWVVSYPKSGSTWVRHLITNLYRQVEFERKFPHYMEKEYVKHGGENKYSKRETISPANYTVLSNASSNITNGNPMNNSRIKTTIHHWPPRAATFDEVDRMIPFLEDKSFGPINIQFLNKSSPRIFKSHQPYNCDLRPCNYFLGNQAKWQCACPNCAVKFNRVIYIVRDGRSVMKSYFHFRKELNHVPRGTNFEKWLMRKRRHYPGPSWGDHVLSWYNRLMEFDEKNYLWLQYENMIKNPTNTIKQLVMFLNLTRISDEGIQRVAKLSSRKEMQKLEATKGAGFFARRYRKRHKSFRMVHNRSTWRDLYNEKTLKYFMSHNGDVMKCMGYHSDKK
jgi:hypothetical protein